MNPRGLLGKGYDIFIFAAIFILASFVVSVLGILIFAAPLWVIVAASMVFVLGFFVFAARITQVRGSRDPHSA